MAQRIRGWRNWKPVQENQSNFLLSLAVLLGIAAVAYADSIVEPISLVFLYALPLVLSALVQRLRTSLVLAALCVVLHDWLGPFQDLGWTQVWRNSLAFFGFAVMVVFVNQLSRQRADLIDQIRRQRDALADEIRLAANVQQLLLPRQAPCLQGMEAAGATVPVRGVGGDYYDYLTLPDGGFGVVIGDVSGKGVAAGLLMSSVEIAMRLHAQNLESPGQVLAACNEVLCQLTHGLHFASLVFVRLSHDGCVRYSNGGHNPPLLLRRAQSHPQWLEKGGPVLGVLPGIGFEEETVLLQPGDRVVLYSDGVTEAGNSRGEEYSAERLVEVARSCAECSASQLVESIHTSVDRFLAGDALEDDATVVVLKFSGAEDASSGEAE